MRWWRARAIAVDAVDALVTVESDRVETQPAQLGVGRGERLKGVFALGEGRGAAKILDVQSLLAEAFAQRARPQRQIAAESAMGGSGTSKRRLKHEHAHRFDVAAERGWARLGAVQGPLTQEHRGHAAPEACWSWGMMSFREQVLPLWGRGLLGFAPASVSDAPEKIVRHIRRRRAGWPGRRSRARHRLRRSRANRSAAVRSFGAHERRGEDQGHLSQRGRTQAHFNPGAGAALSGGRHAATRFGGIVQRRRRTKRQSGRGTQIPDLSPRR